MPHPIPSNVYPSTREPRSKERQGNERDSETDEENLSRQDRVCLAVRVFVFLIE